MIDLHALRPQAGDGAGNILDLESDQIHAFAALLEEAPHGLRGIGRLQQLDVSDSDRQDRVLEPELLRLGSPIDFQPEQPGEALDRRLEVTHHDGQLDDIA
jgi:hypothetical protein